MSVCCLQMKFREKLSKIQVWVTLFFKLYINLLWVI